jgi:hypothetical protein
MCFAGFLFKNICDLAEDPRKNEIYPEKVNAKKQGNDQDRNCGFDQIIFAGPGDFF